MADGVKLPNSAFYTWLNYRDFYGFFRIAMAPSLGEAGYLYHS